LEEWRAIVEPLHTDDIPKHYFEHARNFRREAERVRGDFKGTRVFSEHVRALGHMTPNDILGNGTKPSRHILADNIDAFLKYTRSA